MTSTRLALLSVYIFVAIEWLFYATKPSCLTGEGLAVYSGALILPALLLSLVVAGPILLFALFSKGLAELYAALVSAAFLTLATVFFVDSVLYSAWGVGSLYTAGLVRVLVVGLSALILLRWGWIGLKVKFFWKDLLFYCASLILFIVCFAWRFPSLTPRERVEVQASSSLPNIIIVGSDGLDTDAMGYFNSKLKNTPNLNSLKDSFLSCKRAFSNANRSAGSIISMLTGRLPFETRVVNYPDLLRPSLAYEGLPQILKNAGYYTFESSMRGYADSFDLNLRDGFIEANGRMLSQYELPIFSRYKEVFASIEYNFGLTVLNDVMNRIDHLMYIDTFQSIFRLVKTGDGLRAIDATSISRLLQLLETKKHSQPIFAHLHLLGTHGPGFQPKSNYGTPYQSAIQDFDDYVGELFEFLRAHQLLERTMVFIYSDHDSKNSMISEVPMMVYFPDGKLGGEEREECQLLDVAPTVLREVEFSIPDYMTGAALQTAPAPRTIYTAADLEGVAVWRYKTPPFYQFGGAGVVACDTKITFRFPETPPEIIGSGSCFAPNTVEQYAIQLRQLVKGEFGIEVGGS